MSLINCPECGHEVSAVAVACPNCGHPFQLVATSPRVVVAQPVRPDRDGIPNWIFVPLGILAVAVLFGLIYLFTGSKENDDRVSVNVSAKKTPARETSRSESSAPPPSSADSKTVNVPGTQTAVDSPPDKGIAIIDAKIVTRSGNADVKNEKFYLLDKDLESILNDSGLIPLEDKSMMESFGLSVIRPGEFGDFNRRALNAIKPHIKYSTTTDGSGKAQMPNISPDSYYLFGVTKAPEGYAIWNSSVSISAGQNNLNLSPARVTVVAE